MTLFLQGSRPKNIEKILLEVKDSEQDEGLELGLW